MKKLTTPLLAILALAIGTCSIFIAKHDAAVATGAALFALLLAARAIFPKRGMTPQESDAPAKLPKFVLFIVLIFGCGLIMQFLLTSSTQSGLERNMVNDAEKQYEIVKRSGSLHDACVYAGAVSNAMLQAKDENGFIRWKAIQLDDCKRIGIQPLK